MTQAPVIGTPNNTYGASLIIFALELLQALEVLIFAAVPVAALLLPGAVVVHHTVVHLLDANAPVDSPLVRVSEAFAVLAVLEDVVAVRGFATRFEGFGLPGGHGGVAPRVAKVLEACLTSLSLALAVGETGNVFGRIELAGEHSEVETRHDQEAQPLGHGDSGPEIRN